ncbi:MAG: hypothetical protein ACRDLQ_04390 [Solirubrobacterales bacterium]
MACACLVAAPPAPAQQAPRTAIVFWPGPQPLAKPPALERLAQAPGLEAFGFMSAIQGSYAPEQTFLDMSAGARTTTSLYDTEVPTDLRLTSDGRISSWRAIVERAATAPADVVPGLLASTVRAAGGHIGYVGPRTARNREAAVAADRSGRVEQVALTAPERTGAVARGLWRRTDLLVAKLAPGPPGRGQLLELLGARRAGDLVLVIQDPSHITRRLAAMGAAGMRGAGTTLYSDSTRTEGVVSSTDIAPTVLERLGTDIPGEMSGEPIEARGDATPPELSQLRNRLTDLGPRRWAVMWLGLLGAVLIAGLVGAARGDRSLPGRVLLLGAMWLPSVLLLTGGLAPSAPIEGVIVGAACAVLAIATDRIRPWPRALALPAAVAVGLHVIDLALGSELVRRSLLGPNPVLGSRFFGAGNELEVVLAAVGLLGLGGALSTAPRRTRVWGFAIGGGVLAFTLAWGRLGADVGAVPTVIAGATVAALVAAGQIAWRLRLAILLVAPVAGLAALALLDLVTGGDAHFSRSVLEAGGLDEIADIAERRVRLSYRSLGRGAIPFLVAFALVALAVGFRYRRALLAATEGVPGVRAAVYGLLAAVLVGALTNDSGPIILLIGGSYLLFVAVYLAAVPGPGARTTAPKEPRPLAADHR